MQGPRVGSAVLVAATVILGLGCESASTSARREYPARFEPIATVTSPERPFVPGELPAGWREVGRDVRGGTFRPTEQALYMPAASTPVAGPALVAGYVADEESAPYWCDPPAELAHSSSSSPGPIIRWGRGLTAMPVPGPSYITYNGAYVMGRDVKDADLRRAAASVSWPEPSAEGPPELGQPYDPPTIQLPPGFRLRATSDLAAHEQPTRVTIQLRSAKGQWIWIGQEEESTAGVFLADFWRSTTDGQRCGHTPTLERTIVRDQTVIRIKGPDTPVVRRAMVVVERGLHRAGYSAS